MNAGNIVETKISSNLVVYNFSTAAAVLPFSAHPLLNSLFSYILLLDYFVRPACLFQT